MISNANKSVVIRDMTYEDLEHIIAIECDSYPRPWQQQHFLDEINFSGSFPVVLEVDAVIKGYLCLKIILDEAEILNIAVARESRGKGFGNMLEVYADATARKHSCCVIHLEVRASNAPAIRLYEKSGYIVTGIRRGYYEGKEDALLMSKNML